MSRRADPTGDRFFALRTFRRDGSAVATPIWLAPDRGRWYAYTPSRSWKVARIRRNSRVEVAASDSDGRPLGPFRPGRARIVPRREMHHATRVLAAKYGNRFRLFRLLILLVALRQHGGRGVGLEITLDGHPTASC